MVEESLCHLGTRLRSASGMSVAQQTITVESLLDFLEREPVLTPQGMLFVVFTIMEIFMPEARVVTLLAVINHLDNPVAGKNRVAVSINTRLVPESTLSGKFVEAINTTILNSMMALYFIVVISDKLVVL